MCTSSISNVIYLKFSHGTAFYTLNGKNVNIMLEFDLEYSLNVIQCVRSNYCSNTVFKKKKNFHLQENTFLEQFCCQGKQIESHKNDICIHGKN